MELFYTSKTPLVEFYLRWQNSPGRWTRDKLVHFFSQEVLNGPLFQKEIGRIEPTELKAFFQAMLLDGRKPGTVMNYKIILNHIFEGAVLEGIIDRNPINMTGKLPEAVPNRRMFSEDEIKMIEHCLQLKQFGAVYLFIRYTGLDFDEASSLTWTDVDLKNRTISVKKLNLEEQEEEYRKNGLVRAQAGAMRVIPLCEKALAVVQREQKLQWERLRCTGNEQLLKDGECLVFTDNYGCSYCMNDTNMMNGFVRKKTGIHAFCLSKLRVHFCLELLKSGVNVKTMAEMAGIRKCKGIVDYLKEYEKMKSKMREERNEICASH